MIAIDHDGAVPPYEQLRAQLADQIRSGTLPVGTRLPTVRQLANDLGLAVNTVARGYRELEAGGLVQTRGRAGTYVHTADAAKAQAEAAARTYARTIRSTGISIDDAVELLRTVAASPGT
ncbi:GntR family transcriptional regulator [uncultured Jatrophihabitans sp.]|uniref:GntR family transcriptional regulator n=1 Tax=uncultured Jatrophihabitans sp. TaxID=1610747 RepID=UPI0035CA312B